MTTNPRLVELREKFGKNPKKPEEYDWVKEYENRPERVEFRKDLARWNDLTKDWSDEDREWAWRFIGGACMPRA